MAEGSRPSGDKAHGGSVRSQKGQGAWIFVSHSHKDIEKVREIRNELERRGHNPLLFFLKSMEGDDPFLWELIHREIKAREWFVLCDSPNARDSIYVSREMDLIKSLAQEGKVIETVDLRRDLQSELHKLVRLSRRATVFLSYAHSDTAMAERIRQALLKHDFGVWTHQAMQPADDWVSAINTAIDNAARHGFVLVLLSPSLLQSQFCKHEVEYALRRSAASGRSNVIPICVTAFEPSLLPPELSLLQYLDLTTGSFDEQVEELIRMLKVREME